LREKNKNAKAQSHFEDKQQYPRIYSFAEKNIKKENRFSA
jgi:hypothetical protein